MIKYIVSIIIIMCGACYAEQVMIQWDSANGTVPDEYRVFLRVAGGGYDYSNFESAGSNTYYSVGNLEIGKTYCLIVRSIKDGMELSDSNEVCHTVVAELDDSDIIAVGKNIDHIDIDGNYTILFDGVVYDITVNGIHGTASIVYHGNVKSMIFHMPSCRHYNCKDCTMDLGSRQEAIDSGYTPCGVCKP